MFYIRIRWLWACPQEWTNVHNERSVPTEVEWISTKRAQWERCSWDLQKIELEPYLLHIPQPKYRTAMARLRTSSHSLAIDVGRFHKPRPLPVTDRLCTVCDIIEEEYYHFLCVCPQYSLKRQQRNAPPLLSLVLYFYSALSPFPPTSEPLHVIFLLLLCTIVHRWPVSHPGSLAVFSSKFMFEWPARAWMYTEKLKNM